MENRKKIIVNKEFQYRYIGNVLVPVIILQVILWGSVQYFFNKMKNLGLNSGFQENHPFFKFVEVQRSDLSLIILFAGIAMTIALFVWSIYMSHRIAGPLVKFENMLSQLQNLEEAKTKKLVFRQNDYFKSLAQKYNDFVERLK